MKKIYALLLTCILVSSISLRAQWVNNPAVNTLAASGSSCEYPIAVADSNGNTLIVYRSTITGGYSVRYQKVDFNGYPLWGSAGYLISSDPNQTYTTTYSAGMDPANNALVTWEDNRSGNFDIYASKVTTTGTQSWTSQGIRLSFGTGTDVNPQILAMPDSSVIVAWQSDDSTGIYLQRISPDGQRKWGPTGILHHWQVGSTLHYFQYPHLVACNDTSFYLLFKEANANFNASQQKLVINKFGLSGQTVWPNDIEFQAVGGIPNFTTMHPLSDGNEGCYVAWMDGRGGGISLNGFVQHLDPSGSPMLTANGVNVATTLGALQLDGIYATYDQTGNIYAFYNSTTDLYMQKINSAGTLLLGTIGQHLATSAYSISQVYGQNTPAGLLVNYSIDGSTGTNTYYAALFDTSGNYRWTPTILGVSTSSSAKSKATVTEAKAGQVIVCWQDERSASSEVFVQNIDLTGSIGPLALQDIKEERVGIYPNPSSTTVVISMSERLATNATIEISGSDGRTYKTLPVSSQYESLDVSSVPSGFYFLRIQNDRTCFVKKLEVIR